MVLELGADRLTHPGGAQVFALVDPLFHGDEVDDAFQLVFRADRQGHGNRVGPGAVLDHLDAVEEVGAGLVHLVDEDDARHLVAVSLTPHGFGLGFDAGVAVEQNHSTIQNRQRTFDFDGEVHVAGGVDDVETVLVVRRSLCGRRQSIWRCQKVVVAAEVIVMPRSCSCSIQSMVAAPS